MDSVLYDDKATSLLITAERLIGINYCVPQNSVDYRACIFTSAGEVFHCCQLGGKMGNGLKQKPISSWCRSRYRGKSRDSNLRGLFDLDVGMYFTESQS